MKITLIFLIFSCTIFVPCTNAENKYSAAANKPNKSNVKISSKKVPPASGDIPVPTSIRELDKPYRMAKLNLLWAKAKHVSNLNILEKNQWSIFINLN